MMSFGLDKMVFLKAIMALLIVADHLTFYLDTPFLAPFREIGAPIVSLFLFISGYGLYRSWQNKGQVYLDSFLRKRILRVIVPAIVALIIYYILLWNPARNYGSEVLALIRNGIPLLPFSWYVADIVFFYFAYYLVFEYLPEKFRISGLFFSASILMIATILAGYDRCWWVCSFAFPTGAVVAKHETQIITICQSAKNYAFSLCILCILFILLYLPRNPYLWTLCYMIIPVIAYLLAVRIPLDKLNGPIVVFLSSISYEIYLCQGISMDFFRYRIGIQSIGLFIILVYISVFILAWMVKSLSSLLINPKTT